jgi:hypothetical protein
VVTTRLLFTLCSALLPALQLGESDSLATLLASQALAIDLVADARKPSVLSVSKVLHLFISLAIRECRLTVTGLE